MKTPKNKDNENHNNENKETSKKKLPRFINIHVFLILLIILFPILIVWKFLHWGKIIDKNELANEDIPYSADTLDFILPLQTGTEDYIDDGIRTIAFFGNNPFADDRYDPDNLVNIVKAQTGAEVYNFALKDTYMACRNEEYDKEECPRDAYSFYWLIELLTSGSNRDFYPEAAELMELRGETPPESCNEVTAALTTVDFSNVDIAVIMYDASDYLDGLGMYNDNDHFDKTCFTGSLEAGIVKLQENFPNTRIIVMSPTYAFYRAEDGSYISSDIFYYKDLIGRDVLSTYSIKEFQYTLRHNVTFIDNLYGTITGANAEEYLADHYHLNVKGRRLVADRLVYAIEYYDEKSESN